MGAIASTTTTKFLTLAFVLTSQVAGKQRTTDVSLSVLTKAMLGIDPMRSNPLGQRDPGLKDQIFVPSFPTRSCNNIGIALNDFVGTAVRDVRCSRLSSSSMHTASNMNSYRNTMKGSVSFKAGAGVSASYLGFGGSVSVEAGASAETENEKREKFFQQTKGEIVLGGAECQTHFVSVNLDTKPVFTANFLNALRKLNIASQDPSSDSSRRVFYNFVENYGTHYQDTTTFGSKLVIEKMFSRKSANKEEETKRRNCVSASFNSKLDGNYKFVQGNAHFSVDANLCSDSEDAGRVFNSLGLSSVNIFTVGTPPYSNPDEWAKQAMISPVPIHYNLEKISRIFLQDWFSFLSPEFNGTAMHAFFENFSAQYCEIMFGAPCTAQWTGCGYNSNCHVGEKCINDDSEDGFSCARGCGITSDCPARTVCLNDDSLKGYECKDPSTVPNLCASDEAFYAEPHSTKGYICVSTKPGKAIIAGGNKWGRAIATWRMSSLLKVSVPYFGLGRKPALLRTVEDVNHKPLPSLPREVELSAIAQSGDFIYMCGGRYQDDNGSENTTDDCYRTHVNGLEETWNQIKDAPIRMFGTSAVSIGDSEIWFINFFGLVKYDTRTENFVTKTLPFSVPETPCSVSNGTHAYLISVGREQNEIWRNVRPKDETQWQKVGQLRSKNDMRGCLLYDSNIMITGGYHRQKSVEMFNIETEEVWQGTELLTGRYGHGMMLYNGLPTVFGGFTEEGYSKSFESFNLRENRWKKQSRTLSEKKVYFAFLEIRE